jgi:hypothetical protein
MPPSPETRSSKTGPLLEILDNLVPDSLHKAAWAKCAGAGWFFGHGSQAGDGSAFWKLDLDGDAAFNAIWEHVRPRCEQLAGKPLRVLRQYANGHTYGLGGRPHHDDGSFTLLYYPNPEWLDGWDGETVYYDRSGEIIFSVRPRPNRLVFFDASTVHAGRAPSRNCPVLRVTVAYKLEACEGQVGPQGGSHVASVAIPMSADISLEPVIEELSAEAGKHVYSIRIPASVVNQAVDEKLAALSRSVSLPGFRPGNIPSAVLRQRYGAQVRGDILNRLATETLQRALPKGSMASALELKRGADSGEVEIRVAATHLPDLSPPDFSRLELKRLTADASTIEAIREAAGITPEQAGAHFRGYLKAQVLDFLDAQYRFTVLPALVEDEYAKIWKAAQSQAEIPPDERAQASIELRAIAERRYRLGWVIADLARRNEIRASDGAELEDRVVDFLATQARVEEQPVTAQELLEMMQA